MLCLADNDGFLYSYYNPVFTFDWPSVSYSYNVSSAKREKHQ